MLITLGQNKEAASQMEIRGCKNTLSSLLCLKAVWAALIAGACERTISAAQVLGLFV